MKKIYSLLIIFSTAFRAIARIPIPASPATGNASNCTTIPNIYCQQPGEIQSRFIILQMINDGESAVFKFTVAR